MKPLKSTLLYASSLLFLLSAVSAFAALQEKVLLSFNGLNGELPRGVSMDSSGNLWALMAYGGSGTCSDPVGVSGCGAVVELSPVAAGWKARVIYSFRGGNDGTNPVGKLVFDSQGNIYGVTAEGGAPSCRCGTVFKLTPVSGGWKESVIYRFNQTKTRNDGTFPDAGVMLDAAGNLYGTTPNGGNGCSYNCGVVYELSPSADGTWTETVIYNFKGGAPFSSANDGEYSEAPLVLDAHGNLYGTTPWGGANAPGSCGSEPTGCGVVFELSPDGSGGWTEAVIHSFGGDEGDGVHPQAGLTVDASGNLYGTTGWGGRSTCGGGSYCGTVFELTPSSGGAWTEGVLHSFSSNQGYGPASEIKVDVAGNLYGTTTFGGVYSQGTAFELSPNLTGGWAASTLHSFGNGHDGQDPNATLFLDAAGNLYGATYAGGTDVTDCTYSVGCGTVFEILP